MMRCLGCGWLGEGLRWLNHSHNICPAVWKPDGFRWGACAPVSDLALWSRHQQQDARTLVAGERRHGFLSVLDVLAINLKMTHRVNWHQVTQPGENDATLKSGSKSPNNEPETLFFKIIQENETLVRCWSQ